MDYGRLDTEKTNARSEHLDQMSALEIVTLMNELDAGALKEVVTDPALPVRGIGLVLPKDEAPSFAVREFLNLLNKAPESAR